MSSSHKTESKTISNNVENINLTIDSKPIGNKKDHFEDFLEKNEIVSFILLDESENLNVKSIEEFLTKLNSEDKYVKCISIVGNTGDGKSYCLNQIFFDGYNIFPTSSKQYSCTIGVHCAFDPKTNSLIFDTEGLLSISVNEDKRIRLLLKILAISDVVIYKTRAERLHNDLFKFLADASSAYLKYFSNELKNCSQKLNADVSTLGPNIIIFHETRYTETLKDETSKTVQIQLNEIFTKLKLSCDGFRSIDYFGNSTNTNDYSQIKSGLKHLLANNSVRSPRRVSVIYELLKSLNNKFNGSIKHAVTNSTFPDEYFTCNDTCLACGKRCEKPLSHLKDGIQHENSDRCRYDHQYDNKVYTCKKCYEDGKEVIITPKTYSNDENAVIGFLKYAISGFILECPHHGVIYRSRKYWYGNEEPEIVARTEIKHFWFGQSNHVGTSHNTGRKIIDAASFLGESFNNLSAVPKSLALQWMADKIAPSYWIPNLEILHCFSCKILLKTNEEKHHCRGCGNGFCDKCSSKRKIISWWSPTDLVRVCDDCFAKTDIKEPILDTNARKLSETVKDTLDFLGQTTKYPINIIKETTRPSYWKPDNECTKCFICLEEFSKLLRLHHCRSCGNGVCHGCSPFLKPVPSRGWDNPVRICRNCFADENYA